MAFNCYITFPTTFYAIRAEDILKGEAISFKMVPVPRSISSSCGTALRCSCDELHFVREHLLKNYLELERFYRLEEVGFKTPSVEEIIFDE
jgi:hypothetical protein